MLLGNFGADATNGGNFTSKIVAMNSDGAVHASEYVSSLLSKRWLQLEPSRW